MKKLAFVLRSSTGAEIERVIFDMHWLDSASTTTQNNLEVIYAIYIYIYIYMSVCVYKHAIIVRFS